MDPVQKAAGRNSRTLGVIAEPVDKAAVTFNQLLGRLRSAHEEVCARNAVLELQVAHNDSKGPVESKMDDPWLPVNFLAPNDNGPPPRRLPWKTLAPRAFDVQALQGQASQQECFSQNIVLASHQECMLHQSRSIDNLAKQHECLNQQITKVVNQITSLSQQMTNGRPLKPLPEPQTRAASIVSVSSIGRSGGSITMIEDDAEEGRASTKRSSTVGSLNAASHTTSERFKVSTGKTKDLSKIVDPNGKLKEKKPFSLRMRLQEMLGSPMFNLVSSFLILSYAGLIAFETNLIAQDPEQDSPAIKIMHYVYTGLFLAELVLRLCADGWAALCGEDAFWNRLDAFLIFFGMAEIVFENAVASAANDARSAVRAVRICRVIRTLRIIRTFRQFHDFQKMSYALLSSFNTLLCSLALLVFVMFFFAVWLTQSAADLEMREHIQDLDLRYGDLMSTTYTLFLSVSNGLSWDLCFRPLVKMSWVPALVFILYIIIALFGVLNVVTSVFVESVIRSVQHHKDLIVQDKEDEKKIAVNHVRKVFRQVDSNSSGQVTIEEMEFFLKDPDLRQYMEALDIEASDTILLFHLLDCDKSGAVDVDEFCDGCLRLKGSAKSIDIHTLTFRITHFLDKWVEFTDYVEESFSQIRERLY